MKALLSSRRILSLSVPMILTGIGETIVDVTNSIFLARYGVTELGAAALADAIYGIAIVAVLALVDGIQVIVARRAGEGRMKAVGETFLQGVYLLCLIGAGLTLAIKLGSPLVTDWMIGSEEVRDATDAFLQIVAWKVIFDGLNFAYSALFAGLLKTGPLIGATLILAVVNTALDYALIFGHFGLPRMGIEGAALASVISELAAFLFLTAATFAAFDAKRLGIWPVRRWNRPLTRALVRISSPVFFNGLSETVRWFLFFVIVERLGEGPLAVSNIIYNCYVVFLIGLEGFSETTCSLVSHLIGQGKPRRMWTLMRRAASLSYLTTLPPILLALVWPQLVLLVFESDAAAMAGSINSLRVIALTVLIVIPSAIAASAVEGTGDTAAALAIEVIMSLSALGCAYAAALTFHLPLELVWMSEAIGWMICAVLSYLYLKSGKWQRLTI